MAKAPNYTLTSGEHTYSTPHMHKIYLTIRRWYDVFDAREFYLNNELVSDDTIELVLKPSAH